MSTPPQTAAEGTSAAPSGTARQRLDLVAALLAKEFKVRYKNTALGYVWSVLHPLAFALVYFFAFKVVMRFETEVNYALFLITALFPWQWFANSVNASCATFTGSASLITRVRFPRHLLVLAAVLNDLAHFALSIPVIIAFMLWFGVAPSWQWLWALPLLCAGQFTLVYGLSLLAATLNLFFRDLQRLTILLTTALFFISPVIYGLDLMLDQAPARWQWVFFVNPLVPLMAAWRDLFLHGAPQPLHVLLAAGQGAAALLVAVPVYRRLQWRFAELV
jgi:lipopolysaccharide transport system permease protein